MGNVYDWTSNGLVEDSIEKMKNIGSDQWNVFENYFTFLMQFQNLKLIYK